MARRRIGQEALALAGTGTAGRGSTLDGLSVLIDWAPVEAQLKDVYGAAKGEPVPSDNYDERCATTRMSGRRAGGGRAEPDQSQRAD